jgi:hypothetical protein
VSPEEAQFLLHDLARWTFGALLAEKADFHALPPELLSSEVRAFRYGILCAIWKDETLLERSIAEALVQAPWDLMQEWAKLGLELSWGRSAEERLAEHFIKRMESKGGVTQALRRFAKGKAFKYGRRVLGFWERRLEP